MELDRAFSIINDCFPGERIFPEPNSETLSHQEGEDSLSLPSHLKNRKIQTTGIMALSQFRNAAVRERSRTEDQSL
jgi:hypothetical protein